MKQKIYRLKLWERVYIYRAKRKLTNELANQSSRSHAVSCLLDGAAYRYPTAVHVTNLAYWNSSGMKAFAFIAFHNAYIFGEVVNLITERCKVGSFCTVLSPQGTGASKARITLSSVILEDSLILI